MTRRGTVPLSVMFLASASLLTACASSSEGPGGGSGGTSGTGGASGTGGDIGGTGGAVGTGGAGTGGAAPGDAGADRSGGGDSSVMDPGAEGDGRMMVNRPPTIPMEAQTRLPGVMAGSMRNFNIPAAMGFSGRSGSVYVPAGYQMGTPVAFTICHDATSLQGSEHVTTVADNL